MAIVAFNQFLGNNNQKIAEINKQLQLTIPGGAFTYTNTFNVITKMLIISCTEVTVILTDRSICSVSEAVDINRSMWTSLMSKMDCKACVETSMLIKENILALIAVVSESIFVGLLFRWVMSMFYFFVISKSASRIKIYRF
jgi:hypothetical protein